MPHAALGLRPHSGWAALVAVAGPVASPSVIGRIRIELAGPGTPKQPYHAAEGLPLEKARELLHGCERVAATLASKALREAIADSRRQGNEIAGCGLLLASGRTLPDLPSILASHALIHTADGEHFRRALREATAGERLPVLEVPEKEIWERAGATLARPADRLRREIDAWGKPLGPPWTADQKLAALIAWMALAGEPSGTRAAPGRIS